MTPRQHAEFIHAQNPTFGRVLLARAAECSESMAQRVIAAGVNCTVKSDGSITAADVMKPDKWAEKMGKAGITEKELDTILQSVQSPKSTKSSHTWGNSSFKFACISDTHFGHIKSNADWWRKACDLVGKEKCHVVFHPGDITEGMSGRPGHAYELDAVGVTAQVNLAVERLSMLPCPVEAITGNHDAWAFKNVGVDVGEALAMRMPGHYKNLGPDEADVTIDGVTIKLWHGGDGSSYATSYRTQKFVEGLTGGEKPHILLSGHAHKAIFHECRNVLCFEAGTLCGQTSWMRGKKLAAHVGFWVIEVWPSGDGGVDRISPQWVPFFKE